MLNTDSIYISVDIETAGPNPSTYSLLSIGACNVFNTHKTFYVELKPVNQNKLPRALEICQLDWDHLMTDGISPQEAMSQFADWVNRFSQDGIQPIFVAFNAPFDWMFIQDYFQRYLGENRR